MPPALPPPKDLATMLPGLISSADTLLATPGSLDAPKTTAWTVQMELFVKNQLTASHSYSESLDIALVKLRSNQSEVGVATVRALLISMKDDYDNGRLPSRDDVISHNTEEKLFDSVQAIATAVSGPLVLKVTMTKMSPALPFWAAILSGLSVVAGCFAYSWTIGEIAKKKSLRKSVFHPMTIWLLRIQICLVLASVALVLAYWMQGGVIK